MIRECGDCQECCTQVGVESLDKPAGIRCSHQCSIGCNIYENRPDQCRAFECLWIQGAIDDKPIDSKMVCWAEDHGGLIVLKAVGFHKKTTEWLAEQPVPVLLNDIWHVKGVPIS